MRKAKSPCGIGSSWRKHRCRRSGWKDKKKNLSNMNTTRKPHHRSHHRFLRGLWGAGAALGRSSASRAAFGGLGGPSAATGAALKSLQHKRKYRIENPQAPCESGSSLTRHRCRRSEWTRQFLEGTKHTHTHTDNALDST